MRARVDESLRYAGYTTWRGIARDVDVHSLGTTEIWGAGERFGIVPLGGGEVYWFAVAQAKAGAEDGADVLDELRRRYEGWPGDVDAVLAVVPDGRAGPVEEPRRAGTSQRGDQVDPGLRHGAKRSAHVHPRPRPTNERSFGEIDFDATAAACSVV